MITVAAALARTHTQFANHVAVRTLDGRTKTYAELGREARQAVAGLYNRGVAQGDRVVVLTQNREECFTIDHALAIGGLVRVALSYRLHPKEVSDIVADCQPRAVIVDGERGRDVVPLLRQAGYRGLMVGLDAGPGTEPYSDLFNGDEASAPVEIRSDDIVWMPYTSGTSGRPKGVMHTQRSLLSLARNILVELPAGTTNDVLMHVAPLTHLSGYAMLSYFLRGASQIAVPKFEAEEALKLIELHKVTVLPLVPTMINQMLPHLEAKKYDTASVHTVLYGGSAIAPDRLARALRCLGAVFVQSYGLTEFPWTTWLSKHDHQFDIGEGVPARLAAAGHVSPFLELRLVGADGLVVPDGEEGEIQVRGDGAMRGYWNLPQETAEVILEGGWIATGDVGRMQDGFLYVVDRKKDMIVSGGFNIYPTEIENAIYTISGVLEVAVIGVPSPEWGETVKAIVAVREGFSVQERDIEEACRAQLASFKRPRSVEFVDSLPKTGTGKVLRRVLKAKEWSGQERMVGGG